MIFIRIFFINLAFFIAFATGNDKTNRETQRYQDEKLSQSVAFGDPPRFGRLEDYRKYQQMNKEAHENLKQRVASTSKAKVVSPIAFGSRNSNHMDVNKQGPEKKYKKSNHPAQTNEKSKMKKDAKRDKAGRETKVGYPTCHHTSTQNHKNLPKNTKVSSVKNVDDSSGKSSIINDKNNIVNTTTAASKRKEEQEDRKELVKETKKFFNFGSGPEVYTGERRNMPTNQYDVLQGGPGHAILYTSRLLPHDMREIETCKATVLNGDDLPVNKVTNKGANRKQQNSSLDKTQRHHRGHGHNRKNSARLRKGSQSKGKSTQKRTHTDGKEQAKGNGKRNIVDYFSKVFRQPTSQRVAGNFLSAHPTRHKFLLNEQIPDLEYAENGIDASVLIPRQIVKRDTLGDDWSQAAMENARMAIGYRRGDLLSMEKAIRDLNREDVKFVQRLIPPVEQRKGSDEEEPEDAEFDLDAELDADDLSLDYGADRQRRMVLKRDGVEYFQNDANEQSQDPSIEGEDERQKSSKLLPKREVPGEDDLFEPADVIGRRYQLTPENVQSYLTKRNNVVSGIMRYNSELNGEEDNKEETDDEINDDYTNNLFNVRSIIEEEADLHGGGGTRSYLANIRNKNQQRMLQEKNDHRKI